MVEARDRSTSSTPGWQLILTFYVLLLGVSALGFLAPALATREGRCTGEALGLVLVIWAITTVMRRAV